MSNVISFNVYKNTLRRSSGNDPVSSESGYTEILCRFKEGDDWEGVNGGIVTAGFFVNEETVYSAGANLNTIDSNSLEARFKIPGQLVGNRNPIYFGITGSYSVGNNNYETIATNVVKLDVIRGVVVDNLQPAVPGENPYQQMIAVLNDGLTSKLPKLGTGNVDEIITSKANGEVKRSGVKLSDKADAATVASLLLRVGAVEAKNAEQDTTIGGKAGKVGSGSSAEIITATGSGDIQRSGKSFANSIGEGSPAMIPTTKAVKDALDTKASVETVQTLLSKDEEQDAAIAGKADANSVYTAAQVDTALAGKAAANHTHSEYVTDSEMQQAIGSIDVSGKEDKTNKVASNMASIDGLANQTAKYPSVYAVREYLSSYFYSRSEIDRSTYTKDEVDTALDGKANIADIPFAIPQQYGAMGDGVTDDTAAIQAAIDDDNDLIYFPQGTYIIDTSSHSAGTYGLVIPSNKTLIFDDNAVLKQKELPLFKDGRAVDYAFMLHIPNNASNVTIKGGKIIGDRVYKLETLSEIAKADCLSWYSGSSGHHMGIRLEHCSNVLIEGVTIEDMSGDGISITATGAEYCENITIRNCDVRRSWRNGINIGNCQNIKIEDCTINDSGCNLLSNGSEVVRADVLGESGASAIIERKLINGETGKLCGWPPMCGIDIETDSPVQMPTKQVYIRGCVFTGNAENDIDISNGCDEVYIDSCNCETGITSARKAITGLEYQPTDKIVISNSVIGEINLHGERAVGCVITGKAMSYNDGSVFKGCHINKVQMSVDLPSATHYFEGCEIDALNMPKANNTKCVFQNCTFTIKYTGSRNYFNGNNRLDSCSVYITSSLSTTYSIIDGSAISATNTAFIVIITGANIDGGLFASDLSPRNLILLDCDFDIPSGLKLYEFPGENKEANIKVCGCTFAYKNSFDISSAPGSGTRVIHANTFLDTAATTLAAYGITDAYNKTEVNNLLSGKYEKPSGGIPKTDLSSEVQTSLGKADSALQSHQSLANYYNKTEVNNLLSGKYEKPSGGIPKTDLSSEVQTSLGKADSALQSHQSLANYYNKTEANNLLSGKADTSHTHSQYLTLATLPIYNGGVQ